MVTENLFQINAANKWTLYSSKNPGKTCFTVSTKTQQNLGVLDIKKLKKHWSRMIEHILE